MNNKLICTLIVLVSFGIAVLLGMSDHETQSLVHLFTAEWGNVLMLFLLTVAFSTIGIGMAGCLRSLNRRMSR